MTPTPLELPTLPPLVSAPDCETPNTGGSAPNPCGPENAPESCESATEPGRLEPSAYSAGRFGVDALVSWSSVQWGVDASAVTFRCMTDHASEGAGKPTTETL